jgi:hypothetical protein
MKKLTLGFVCSRFILITALLVVIFWTCIPVDAEETLELYTLENPALLEKAATLFNAIEPVLKAQKRALQHDVQHIEQLEERLARTTPLEALPELPDTPSPEELEKRIGEIENRHQALKRNTPLLEEKKALLNQQRKSGCITWFLLPNETASKTKYTTPSGRNLTDAELNLC